MVLMQSKYKTRLVKIRRESLTTNFFEQFSLFPNYIKNMSIIQQVAIQNSAIHAYFTTTCIPSCASVWVFFHCIVPSRYSTTLHAS